MKIFILKFAKNTTFYHKMETQHLNMISNVLTSNRILLTCWAYWNGLANRSIAHRIILTTDVSHLNVKQMETETGGPLLFCWVYFYSIHSQNIKKYQTKERQLQPIFHKRIPIKIYIPLSPSVSPQEFWTRHLSAFFSPFSPSWNRKNLDISEAVRKIFSNFSNSYTGAIF